MSDEVISCCCPHCAAPFYGPVESIGQEVECSKCLGVFVLEAVDSAEESVREESVEDELSEFDDLSDGPTTFDPDPESDEPSEDISYQETRIDLENEEQEDDLDMSEEELMDLSESDTEPPYKPTPLVDLSAGDTNDKVDLDDDLSCDTARLMRKNQGMVPLYGDEDKFAPFESSTRVEVDADELKKNEQKSWWQFWK